MLKPTGFEIQLKNLHCFDEGDGIGSSEPYLWAVFFTVDGTTAVVNGQLLLQGAVSFITTNLGDHGNLNDSDVDAGDDVPIPEQFGLGGILTPIPFEVPFTLGGTPPIYNIGGVVGCLVILLEENDTGDSAVADGHAELVRAVEDGLNQVIPLINFGQIFLTMTLPEEVEKKIEKVRAEIKNRVYNAIKNGEGLLGPTRNILLWLAAGLPVWIAVLSEIPEGLDPAGAAAWAVDKLGINLTDMDLTLGSEVFLFFEEDLLDAGPGGKVFKRAFNSDFDVNPLNDYSWLISGRVSATWSQWEDLGGPPVPPVISGGEKLPTSSLDALEVVTHPGGPISGGQEVTSAPAAASWGENHLNTFVRGAHNHMWHRWWGDQVDVNTGDDNGGILTSKSFARPPTVGWSEWEDLGGPPVPLVTSPNQKLAGTSPSTSGVSQIRELATSPVKPPIGQNQNQQLASAPAAVSWGPNRIDCFGRGLDQHMWHKWWHGSAWNEWEDLGGILTSAPAVAAWGPNRLDCFGRGADQHMWHKWWDGSTWNEWEDLGGNLVSAPAVAAWGPNRLDCFARGPQSHMWHKWWDGMAWSGWEDLGGFLTTAPAVVSLKENRLDCFARGTQNHMVHKWWDGSEWSEWENLGGSLKDSPAAVSWGPARVDCFVRDTNNHMSHIWWGQ